MKENLSCAPFGRDEDTIGGGEGFNDPGYIIAACRLPSIPSRLVSGRVILVHLADVLLGDPPYVVAIQNDGKNSWNSSKYFKALDEAFTAFTDLCRKELRLP